MTGRANAKKRRLRLRRRPAEFGLTLIELLLSLVILSLLAGFVVGGLSVGRRAFDVDQASANDAKTDAAIQSVLSMLASAFPYPSVERNSNAFEGNADSIRFVVLSEGRALRGGTYTVALRRVGSELVAELGGRPGAKKEEQIATVIILRGVRAVRFEYFGAASQPVWQKDWHSPVLPNLVSMQVDFENGRSSGPRAVVALRQG